MTGPPFVVAPAAAPPTAVSFFLLPTPTNPAVSWCLAFTAEELTPVAVAVLVVVAVEAPTVATVAVPEATSAPVAAAAGAL